MSVRDQLALAGLSGGRERGLAQQLSTGQRVLVQMKRSEYDLEPEKQAGVIKYIGKIDSEFIDNNIYVGVKLDEPGATFLCRMYVHLYVRFILLYCRL